MLLTDGDPEGSLESKQSTKQRNNLWKSGWDQMHVYKKTIILEEGLNKGSSAVKGSKEQLFSSS